MRQSHYSRSPFDSGSTGAAVPNATVTAANIRTGVTSTVRTNNAGVYLFAALPPAAYRVRIEHEGFQAYVYEICNWTLVRSLRSTFP